MAKRMAFIVTKNGIEERLFDFKYYSGFALSQKQKSILSFHEEINKCYKEQVLEISSKSPDALGKKLSAFNLMVKYKNRLISVENIFQASKAFENGGPYEDLLFVKPIEAKKDERLKKSGALIAFRFNGKNYPIKPKTLFYDWIYCRALSHYSNYIEELIKYSIFTDIEFNNDKSYNCQARSVAIYVYLEKCGLTNEALSSIDKFLKYSYEGYKSLIEENSIFDYYFD